MGQNTNRLARQRKLSIITIIAVYLLILVGGIVRSSGSGMGCPDWPKCFGNWVPPTSAEQLPANYKEIYSQKRHQKNLRFANYLDALGMEDTSGKIRNDPAILEEADFNPVKTWIEYVNRLVGVTIGFLILLTFVHSFKLRNERPIIFWLSLLAFVGVVFQGWIGSIVVSTNLLPGMISFHMLLALLIVVFLIAIYFKSSIGEGAELQFDGRSGLKWLLAGCIAVYLIQMVVGINIREVVDSGLAAGVARGDVLTFAGSTFLFHRSFSWLLLLGHLLILYFLWSKNTPVHLTRLAGVLTVLVLAEIVSGAAMGFFAIPAVIQPVHLLIASLIFGIQVYLLLLISRKRNLNFSFE